MALTEHLRVQMQRSRARSIGMPASLSLTQWEQTLADFKGMCAYCLFRPFEVLEHFIPMALAGTTANNCLPACYPCNYKKRDLTGQDLILLFGYETIKRLQCYLTSRCDTSSNHPDHSQSVLNVFQERSIPLQKKGELAEETDVLTITASGTRKMVKLLPEGLPIYSLKMLYEALPISLIELGERANLNEITIARIRDGKTAIRRTSVNRLLLAFSELYNRPLSLKNVSGINLEVKKRGVLHSQGTAS